MNGAHKTVGRSPTARRVRSSTVEGESEGLGKCPVCLD